MLKLEKIDFKIAAFDKYDDTDGIIIFKPHGSISFCSKDKRISSQPYNIEKDPIDSTLAEIKVMENNLEIVEDMSNISRIGNMKILFIAFRIIYEITQSHVPIYHCLIITPCNNSH